MNPNEIKIKAENTLIYELESDETFDYDALDEEAQKVIDAANEKYENNELQNALRPKAVPCACMAQELQERALRRASLLAGTNNGPMNIQIQLEQKDFDQKNFVVILNTEKGYYSNIRCIISHCKRCGELHFWGELEPFGDVISRRFVDYDTTQANKEKREAQMKELIANTPVPEDGRPQFVLEDTETGELTPADDLVRSLAGGGPVPEDMKLDTVEEASSGAEPPKLIIPD